VQRLPGWLRQCCRLRTEYFGLNLRCFRYFVRIVDVGSLTQAADLLRIAPPELSQQRATLEGGVMNGRMGRAVLYGGRSAVHGERQGGMKQPRAPHRTAAALCAR
jgi:Bacterial regulatory helix-turn-helix protein, lysR family